MSKPTRPHIIVERKSPADVLLFCSCGWSFRTTRRQNALARAAKVRAAYRRHSDDVEKREGGESATNEEN